MVYEALIDGITSTIIYTLTGGLFGIILMVLATFLMPMLVDRLTPHIDDQGEILRGNLAVANYIGQVTQAVILGTSIIIAAAVIAAVI